MIMVLLNLAYIPDDVIHKTIDFEPGWSTKFREAMSEYKEDFNQKVEKREGGLHGQHYNTKWRYQCKKLEKRYFKFVEKRE